ncbi:hypothetical protein ACFSSA_13455 [Luteolibacter algae]|uniref:Uncharacterized protein n=1 Tax=Luteolibacter algae TaxID=454151 RepID=A0ABW5DCN4_9BACT
MKAWEVKKAWEEEDDCAKKKEILSNGLKASLDDHLLDVYLRIVHEVPLHDYECPEHPLGLSVNFPHVEASEPRTNPDLESSKITKRSAFWGDLTPAQKVAWGVGVLAAIATVTGVVFAIIKPS